MSKLIEIWEFKFQFRRQPKAKSNTLWLAAAAVGCFQNGADFFLEAGRHVVMLLYDTFANVISAASIPCQETSEKKDDTLKEKLLAEELLKEGSSYCNLWQLKEVPPRPKVLYQRNFSLNHVKIFHLTRHYFHIPHSCSL